MCVPCVLFQQLVWRPWHWLNTWGAVCSSPGNSYTLPVEGPDTLASPSAFCGGRRQEIKNNIHEYWHSTTKKSCIEDPDTLTSLSAFGGGRRQEMKNNINIVTWQPKGITLYIEGPDTPASLSDFGGGRRQEMKITFILTLNSQKVLYCILKILTHQGVCLLSVVVEDKK